MQTRRRRRVSVNPERSGAALSDSHRARGFPRADNSRDNVADLSRGKRFPRSALALQAARRFPSILPLKGDNERGEAEWHGPLSLQPPLAQDPSDSMRGISRRSSSRQRGDSLTSDAAVRFHYCVRETRPPTPPTRPRIR
jgi:hypothetical protein